MRLFGRGRRQLQAVEEETRQERGKLMVAIFDLNEKRRLAEDIFATINETLDAVEDSHDHPH